MFHYMKGGEGGILNYKKKTSALDNKTTFYGR